MRHFSRCIRLDPINAIYYSNRAAAHTALKSFNGALSDGKEVVRLKPQWAKGWARIAAAHFGLEAFQEVASLAWCLEHACVSTIGNSLLWSQFQASAEHGIMLKC